MPRKLKTRNCKRCQSEFVTRDAIFCTRSCKSKFFAANGSMENMHKKVRLIQHGKTSSNWKGGRIVKRNYVLIWSEEFGRESDKYILEHRLVMSHHLGRRLLPSEHVHHINENRQDNRIENLQILSCSEHARKHANEQWKEHKDRAIKNQSRVCQICKTDKSLSEFYNCKRFFLGKTYVCKECQKKRVRKRYELKKEKN
jgi:hypothetical protein